MFTDKQQLLQKLAALENNIVNYSQFALALNGILECVEATKFYQAPENGIISGKAGIGKTTLTRIIRNMMPDRVEYENHCEITIKPVIYAEVPAKATSKSLAQSILKALGVPVPHRDSCNQLTERIIELFKKCKTELVLLDEFHNLVDVKNRDAAANAEATSWLRQLSNVGGTSYQLLGTPGYLEVVRDCPELERRFENTFELDNLFVGDPKNPGTLDLFYENVSKAIQNIFDYRFIPSHTDMHFMNQLYAASSGIPDAVIKLIKGAITHAWKSNSDILTTIDFADAWSRGKGRAARLTKSNPFLMNVTDLALKIKEPKH